MRTSGNGGRLDASFLEAASVGGASVNAPTIAAAETIMRATLWSIRVVKRFWGPGKPCRNLIDALGGTFATSARNTFSVSRPAGIRSGRNFR
jgi:hypothetical protein